jgi:hypothetical protein
MEDHRLEPYSCRLFAGANALKHFTACPKITLCVRKSVFENIPCFDPGFKPYCTLFDCFAGLWMAFDTFQEVQEVFCVEVPGYIRVGSGIQTIRYDILGYGLLIEY